jgi:hypothetical protein
VIRIPTLGADQEVVVLGLDDLLAELLEFESEVTAVALGNRVLA